METISASTGIRGAAESFIGGREENQDSFGMVETRLGMLVVVCDGMGGGPGGKTASSIATRAIIDYVSGAAPDSNPVSVLEDAAVSANESVLAAVSRNPALRGMGTTCVCVLVAGKSACIMHVGDSRCYQFRGEKVLFRTADHSYVGELVRRGTMTEEEARNSNFSNVITRAIGGAESVEPEVDVVDVRPGDRFALMTDGIWGTMPESHLTGVLSYDDYPESLVPQITARVDAVGKQGGGGHDNLTLVMLDIPGKRKMPEPAPSIQDVYETTRKATVGEASSRLRPATPKMRNDEVAEPVTGDAQKAAIPSEDEAAGGRKKKSSSSYRRSLAIVWSLIVALSAAIVVIAWLLISGATNSGSKKVSPIVIHQKERTDSVKDGKMAEDSPDTEKADQGRVPTESRAKEGVKTYLDDVKGVKNASDKSAR